MATEKKYPVMLDKETINKLVSLIAWSEGKFPRLFMPQEVWQLQLDLNEILREGCFKHGILREKYKTELHTLEAWCPKCNPKECEIAKIKSMTIKER